MATQAQLDAIAAAYVAGDTTRAAGLIATGNISAGTLRAAFNLNDADVAYLQGQGIVGGSIAPAPAPAPASVPPPGGGNPLPAPAPAPVPAGPAYAGISGLAAASSLGQSGGSFVLPNGQFAAPVYGNGGYDASAGDYVAGAITEYMVYDRAPGEGGTARYANQPFTRVDPAGNIIGYSAFSPDIGKTDWIETVAQIGVAIGAALVGGNAVGLIGSPGGAAAGATTGGTAGPTLSKAVLDGTNVFGANSVAGAYQIGGTVATGAATVASGAGSTIAQVANTAANTVGGAVRAIAAVAGVAATTNATGKTTPPVTPSPTVSRPGVNGSQTTGTSTNTWLALAAAGALGYFALKG